MKIIVTAKRWTQGWELHIDGYGVTQTKTLAGAAQQVADYLESLRDVVVNVDDIWITPELPERLLGEVRKARNDITKAEEELSRAAAQQRRVARALRKDAHLSVSDTAAVMEISRGRVSQLTTKKGS